MSGKIKIIIIVLIVLLVGLGIGLEELHYIKIQVEIGYIGSLEQELEERKAELRDRVNNHLMKLNAQRAKEDYVDRFMHKDLERELNNVLGKSTSESRIIQVVIPTFLIN